ncbi:unnamed protein product [Closterium sp. Yama58-4]|nr:unnamed protein product [Closterium sp. Yama58-4]
MSAVDAAWQRLKAATAPAAMAGSRLSAAPHSAALDGAAARSADHAAQATAGNLGETPRPPATSDARGERSGGETTGKAEGALGSAEGGGPGQGEGWVDGGAREGGNMEVDGDEGDDRRSEEGNKEGDAARENATAAAAAGAERAAAAAAALRATQAAAGGAVVDDSKVQVREVVDFAGEAVEVVRVLDARSKEAAAAKRKADMQASTSKGLDAILAQMEKKKKLNILDKSRKDWSEYKEGAGVAEELEEYRRSGATYTEKRAFLGQLTCAMTMPGGSGVSGWRWLEGGGVRPGVGREASQECRLTGALCGDSPSVGEL